MAGDLITIMHLIKIFLDSQNSGGLLMWVIFMVGIVSSCIGFDKLVFLIKFGDARNRFLKNIDLLLNEQGIKKSTGFEMYDILLTQIDECLKKKSAGLRGVFREFLICSVPALNRHFSTMNAWVSVAPLLGLLGTVFGMVQTFKVIMDFGVGNPALTAEGISVALLTTQAGLTVAFPVMIFHNYLTNKKIALLDKVIQDFEEIVNRVSRKVTTV